MVARRRPRSWRYIVECLRDPPRSDFAFVPHQYISAPVELSDSSEHSDESTPINSRSVHRFSVIYRVPTDVSCNCIAGLSIARSD